MIISIAFRPFHHSFYNETLIALLDSAPAVYGQWELLPIYSESMKVSLDIPQAIEVVLITRLSVRRRWTLPWPLADRGNQSFLLNSELLYCHLLFN